jgi:hypothetical protein
MDMEMEMRCTGTGTGTGTGLEHAGQARILWAAAAIDSGSRQVEVCSPVHRLSRI